MYGCINDVTMGGGGGGQRSVALLQLYIFPIIICGEIYQEFVCFFHLT